MHRPTLLMIALWLLPLVACQSATDAPSPELGDDAAVASDAAVTPTDGASDEADAEPAPPPPPPPLPPDAEPPREDSPLNELAPGQWLEVAESHLEAHAPDGWTGQVIRAWNGGAYDTRRHRLVVFGGGHNNYSGNEIYAFDLDELAWERLTDPADPYCRASWRDGTDGCVGVVNPDGTPISRHTYGGLAYDHGLDALYARDGAPDSARGGCGTRGVWFYYFARGEWVLYEDDTDSGPVTGCEHKAVYDPASGQVIHRSNGYFAYELDPDCALTGADFGSDPTGAVACPGRWQRVGDSPSNLRRGYDVSGRTLVHAGDVLYEVGGNDRAEPNSNGVGNNVWRIDPADGYAVTPLDTVGENACTGASNPGVAYHAPTHRLVCWIGGADIYSLPLDGSGVWERHGYDGPVSPPEVTASGGVYGRFRYAPAYDVFVTVNAIDENVFVYRLPATEG